ncbi:hypothetical protein ZIOFF_029230 [Zingiber officinale]|uniref:Integrase catalytic domain-containing protein n=1 Tax=Zingiber officinale TaxID=94328 RepID=A0A8J5GP87_ZINOF|nr:hypothetical protein ZIOFF_029230 [Zingiber officinale]
MWVFILAAKNDAFRAFKKFKLLTETKTEYKIKTLRTDRGGEFLSTEFTQFCENEGIERHLSAPYTPQQNGVVERCNRTVMAMARSLLKGTHMPARFWGEAVRHAVYLLNRLPTKALGECTPFEAWMGRKPHLAHLRVFGCVAYVKNTTPRLKKLDDRSSPMVYLGVEDGCKVHRLFDPRHDKLHVSRDVMFRENCEWTWNAGANNKEKVPEFMVVDAFGTDEVIVAADIEAAAEDVTTPAVAVAGASSPSTSSSNTNTVSSPSITNSPESYEGPVRFRSIVDIYANTEEVVGIDEEEGEVMMMISEEPTCYQEVATEACCLVSWNSQKQKTVTLSSCEAEFMAATTATCHALWLRSLASELTGVEPKPFVNTGEQGADALTKALPGVKLAVMRQLLGVRDLEPCQD